MPTPPHSHRMTLGTLAVCGAALLCTAGAHAQLVTVSAPPGFEQPVNTRVGSFVIGTRAEAGLISTSNIRLDPSEEADTKRILAVSANASSDWQKHNLAASVDFFGQDAKGSRHDDLDNEALSGALRGRYELGGNAIARASLQRQQSLIGKNHVDQLNGFLHGTTTSSMAAYGLEWDNQRWFLSAMGQNVDVVNDTDIKAVDDVMVESLDRKESQGTLQAGRHFSWGNVYGFVGSQAIQYVASESLTLADRDSSGWRAGAGTQFSHGKLRGAVSAIRFAQDFDTTSIRNTFATVGTVQLNYQLSQQFALSGLLQRSFSETNIPDTAGIFTTTYFLGMLYAPGQNWFVKLGPAYNRDRLADSSLATKRVSWEGQAVWQAFPRVAFSLAASHSDQRVSDPSMLNQQYDDTSITLSAVFAY